MSIYMQKIKVRYQLLQEISSLKESCNLIGREVWPITQELDFSRICGFRRMIEDHEFFHFREKKVHINGLDFCQNSENLIFRPFWALFAQIWANGIFPEKSGSVTFDPLWTPNFMQKIRKN